MEQNEIHHVKVVGASSGKLDHPELLSDRSFSIHVIQAYPVMVTYLKGINLTPRNWWGNQDEDDWKSPHVKPQADESLDPIKDKELDKVIILLEEKTHTPHLMLLIEFDQCAP